MAMEKNQSKKLMSNYMAIICCPISTTILMAFYMVFNGAFPVINGEPKTNKPK